MPAPRWSPIPAGEPLIAGGFDEGPGYQTWRPQGSNDWELLYTLAGAARFGHRDGEVRADAHSAVLLRPGTPHDYGTHRSAAGWRVRWVHFLPREGWLDLLAWSEAGPGILIQEVADAQLRRWLPQRLAELAALSADPDPRRRGMAPCLLEEALHRLALARADAAPDGLDPRLRAVVDRVAADPGAGLDRADAARLAGMSTSRFSHVFSAALGVGFNRWVEELRLRQACRLLDATDRTVAAIASQLGFADPFYFSARFRRYAGMSPRAWRARGREAPGLRPEPPGHRIVHGPADRT